MAESSLSLTYTELQFAVGHYLGMGAVTSWSSEDTAVIDMAISSGLRQFYWPPAVMQDGRTLETPYEWKFLKPPATLDTIAPYSTGTIAIAEDDTTVTLTTGVWPDWTATHGSLIIGTAEYVIDTRTDDTHLELAEAWSEDTETEAEYVLQHNGNYDLPDDYGGGIENGLVIESSNYNPRIVVVGEGVIRSYRQNRPQTTQSSTSTVTPFYVAVRPKKHDTTTTGQRFEIMFFPLPSTVYTVSYVYRVNPQMLVTTTIEYPYGGATHAETIRAACVAAAEEQENGNRLGGNPVYDKKKLFQERLAASIQLDRKMNGIADYGYNGDNSDLKHRAGRDSDYGRNRRGCDTSLVTYNNGI